MRNPVAFLAVGALLALSAPAATAQIVTATPWPLQQSSQNVRIFYHADQGNGALKNTTGAVYAHTGVITEASTSSGDWKHAPQWKDNDEKYLLTKTADNTYELTIGNMADYYGLEEGETVKQLAFVFRNSDGTVTGKTDAGGDIMVNVAPEGFAIDLASDARGQVLVGDATVSFTLASTQAANLSVSVNGTVIKSASGATSLVASHHFSGEGTYNITGTAVADGQTLTQTITLKYLGAAANVAYPGGLDPKENMGARTNADGSVTFCLAAPGKESVVIVGSWDNYEPMAERVMNRTDKDGITYFWTTVKGLNDAQNYPYYYLVDGTIKVGDPYAKLVLDCYNDRSLKLGADVPAYPYDLFNDTMLAVYNSQMDSYDWAHRDSFEIPAHSDLVIYELLLRDFTGKNSTADGTIAMAREKLGYLKNLGVNAIELMPVMEFNGNNSWGYNTNFYMALDKAYGTPSELRAFVDECHSMGIAVILDVVLNHSDGLHPWYQMYPSASNPFYNATAPHDWSVLNDWRQEHPLVEQQWKDALQYWLDAYDVDGYRFDLVKGLGDSDSYKSGTDNPNTSRSNRMKRLHAYMMEIKPNAIHINEGFLWDSEEKITGQDGQLNWCNVSEGSLQTAMGWPSSASLNRYYAPSASRDWGTTVSYAESHDEERMGYKIDKYAPTGIKGNHEMKTRRLGMVGAQMLFTPGAHMIWQFQELGADQTTKSASGDNNTSPKKVVWNYLDDEHRNALMETYRTMIHFRHDNPALFRQGADTYVGFSGWTLGRSARLGADNQEAVLLVNPNPDETATVEVSCAVKQLSQGNYKVIAHSYGIDDPQVTFTSDGKVSCQLPAGAFVLVATTSVTALDGVLADSLGQQPTAWACGGIGEIIINGSYTSLSVHNLAGQRMGGLQVPAGLYIVNIDGHATKVAVR